MTQDEMIARLASSAEYDVHSFFRRCIEIAEKKSESPIETLLAAAFLVGIRLDGSDTDLPLCFGSIAPHGLSVVQQFQWKTYRIDFALFLEGVPVVFVECDGHDFHERTKEQAERDRSRDREIQTAGLIALRFTGREIWRDASACSLASFEAVLAHMRTRK